VLTDVLGVELRRPPSDSSFRYFFHQMDVSALCAAIRDWTIAQIPGGAADLDQLVCDGKTLRGSIEPTVGGGSAFIAQVTLYSAALGVAYCYAEDARIDVNPSWQTDLLMPRGCSDRALKPPSTPPAMGERAGCLAAAWASKIRPLRPLSCVPVGCPAESGRPPGQ
jgi:hypothetical protein